ncbi:LysR family transcriptional regulator [Marinobacterium aestuariivivens]|uniref:LysR family transcriptional regulator n=1 Tax=Marinobacterium aestuariivivens TaxID=1698799 RepID=A0ABW2A7K7_9GAMM
MDPRLLKQLAVIVKHGSLSRAAERLNVTQPTLTRAIQTIEHKVGGRCWCERPVVYARPK